MQCVGNGKTDPNGADGSIFIKQNPHALPINRGIGLWERVAILANRLRRGQP